MNVRLSAPLTLAAALVLFIAVNLLGARLLSSWRADFTEHGIYTLSEGTQQVLSSLEEPVMVRLFYSEKEAIGYPAIQSYATRIRGLLEQYARLSQGKLTFEVISPEAFSEEEDLAVASGIQGISVNDAGARLYFGLAATGATDETLAIPYLDIARQSFLEYDLSRLIDDAANPKKPVVGLLSGAPMEGGLGSLMQFQKPWVLLEQLRENFELKELKGEQREIPENVKVLVVVHPQDLSENTLKAIDQFVLSGGRAIFFLDAHFTSDSTSSGLAIKPLLDAWGVQFVQDRVAADTRAAMRVQVADADGSRIRSAMNAAWLELSDEDTSNRQDVSSAQLRVVRMIESGYFTLNGSKVKTTPLLMTHKQAGSIPVTALKENKDNPVPLASDMKPENVALPLAVRLQGKVPSAFKGLKHTEGNIQVALVGDVDMLQDQFWVNRQEFFGKSLFTPTSDNGAFALNLVDSFTGNASLIGLRSRGNEERPFTVVGTMRQEAEKKFQKEETRLKSRLKEIEKNMQALGQQREDPGSPLLSEAEQREMKNFRSEMVRTRKELRDVQRNLQKDIESLKTRLQWLNIGLMPLLVLAGAFFLPQWLGVGARRRVRRG